MEHINNTPEQIAIRKLQNNLIIVGSGTILFSIWTAIKMMGSLFLLKSETVAAIRETAGMNAPTLSDNVVFISILIVSGLIFAIDVLLRTFLGLSAIHEGQDSRKHKGSLYLLFAGILVLLSILSIIAALRSPGNSAAAGAFTYNTSVSSIIIELTSTIMMTEMIVSAIKIRKLRRALKGATKAETKG